jgi:hypothetical protein
METSVPQTAAVGAPEAQFFPGLHPARRNALAMTDIMLSPAIPADNRRLKPHSGVGSLRHCPFRGSSS